MPSSEVWQAWHALQNARALLCHFPGRPDLVARERAAMVALAAAESADALRGLSKAS